MYTRQIDTVPTSIRASTDGGSNNTHMTHRITTHNKNQDVVSAPNNRVVKVLYVSSLVHAAVLYNIIQLRVSRKFRITYSLRPNVLL